jgi:nitrate reductase NapAB chaperone NapD
MPILSYIASPYSGNKEALLRELNDLQFCTVFPADNAEILILVTDSPDRETEKRLQQQLKDMETLESLSMTFGYDDKIDNDARRGKYEA